MEENLAAVEEDVERRRVAKNPFEKRFRSLRIVRTTSSVAENASSVGKQRQFLSLSGLAAQRREVGRMKARLTSLGKPRTPRALCLPSQGERTGKTESSFAESGDGDEQKMDSISRHIIVRMQVIAKQIAFLSKETSGQPHKVLAASGDASTSADGGNESQRNQDSPKGNGGDRDSDGSVDGEDMSIDDGSPSTRELDGLLDLFQRIRHGQAAASELFPSGMLFQTLGEHRGRTEASSPSPLTEETAVSSCAIGEEAFTRRKDRRNDSECHRDAPPGVLHQFIKHVLPFSICLPDASKRSLLRAPSSTASPGQDGGGRTSDATGVIRNEGGLVADHQSGLDHEVGNDALPPGEEGLYLEQNKRSDHGTGKNGYTPSYPESHLSSGSRQSLLFPSPPSAESIQVMPGAGAPTASFGEERGGGIGSRGCMGAPRKVSSSVVAGECRTVGRGVEEDRVPAGKRKLSLSPLIGLAATSTATGASPRAAAVPTATAAGGSRGNAPGVKAHQGIVRHDQKTEKAQSRRHSTGKSSLVDGSCAGSGRVSLSWKAAKIFRKRMEGATAARRLSTPGASAKKGARGGRNKGANQITLPDSGELASSSVSSIGSLSLVQPYAHLDPPGIKSSLDDYLISLANPARDLVAMKAAFCERSRSNSSPSTTAASMDNLSVGPSEPSGSAGAIGPEVIGAAPEDGRDWPPVEAEEEERLLTPAPEPKTASELLLATPGSQRMNSPDLEVQEGGTCIIDLKNIWQRTGEISRKLSQGVKASQKRSNLANDLCKAFSRLDVRRRLPQGAQEGQERHYGGDGADLRRTPNSSDEDHAFTVRLREPSSSEVHRMPSTSQSGGREDEGVARRFALVVSLTHAHNVSVASGSTTTTASAAAAAAQPPYAQPSGEGGYDSTRDDDDRAGQQAHRAQLKLEVPNGDDDDAVVVVTACSGK